MDLREDNCAPAHKPPMIILDIEDDSIVERPHLFPSAGRSGVTWHA
jgi:hypothetical protein